MKRLISIVLLLACTKAYGALAVDSEMPSNVAYGSATISSLSFAFVNTAGTLLVCGVMAGGGTPPTINTVTYNSVSMGSADATQGSDTNTNGKLAIYHLLSPATGRNTFTCGTSASSPELACGCISFTGNDTSSPIKQAITNNDGSIQGTTASLAFSSVVSGNITVALAGAGSSMSAQTQSLTFNKAVNSSQEMGNVRASRSTSSGSVTHSFTISSSDFWATVGVEVAAAAGGAGFDKRRKLMRYYE